MASVFKEELYKVFIKGKLIILFLFLLVIKIISFCNDQYSYSWKSHSETEFYESYMKQINGCLTDEKAAKIEADIDDEKLLKEHFSVMQKIEDNYRFVCEEPSRRYFTTPNIFEMYFINLKIDWIFLFVIIIICAQLITTDFNSGVIQTTMTSRYGRMNYGITKGIILIGTITIISITLSGIQLAIYSVHYSVSDLNTPIQSIYAYKDCSKELNYVNAYLMINLFRWIAYVVFGLIVFSVASLLKQPLSVSIVSILMVFLPYYFMKSVEQPYKIYKLPIPVGTLDGTGYITGNIYDLGKNILCKELAYSQIAVVITVQIVIGIFAFCVGIVKISGKKIKKNKFGIVIIACFIFILTGCRKKTEDVIGRMSGSNRISDSYIQIDNNTLYDLKNKKIIDIRQTIFDDRCILAVGDEYILTKQKEIEGSTDNEFTIELYNPINYKSKTLIRFGKNIDEDALLGLEYIFDTTKISQNNEAIVNMGINESVVYENDCIFYSYENVVVKADCKTENFEIIYYDSVINNAIIYNNSLTYIDGENRLVYYSFDDKQECILDKNVMAAWLINGNIIYQTIHDNNIYFLQSFEMQKMLLDNISLINIVSDDTYICIQDIYGTAYILGADSLNIRKIIKVEAEDIIVGIRENIIYVLTYDGNEAGIKEMDFNS